MTTPHASALAAPPEVGRIYTVPCLRRKGVWIPVAGALHADPELAKSDGTPGPETPHWHIDWRFMSPAAWRRRTPLEFGSPYALGYLEVPRTPDERPTDRRRRCYLVGLEFPGTSRDGIRVATTVEKIERALAGKRLDLATMICPHRGFCLRSQPVTTLNGRPVVTCAGHGACWSLETGELVSRQPGARGAR